MTAPTPGTTTARIAAVILAAGTSSRMGNFKPLLPLGEETAIERVVETARRAGMDQVVVVTGHRAEELEPVLEALGVRIAYNAAYETGMFSSVQTGVAALPEHAEAFFILPVDCCLVRPAVLQRLIRVHAGVPDATEAPDGADTPGAQITADFPAGVDTSAAPEAQTVADTPADSGPGDTQGPTARSTILHPTCCGLRGHPPLIPGRYRTELVQANAGDDLGSFLRRHGESGLEVEVKDLSILMDMDDLETYERLRRFAGTLDVVPGAADTGGCSASGAVTAQAPATAQITLGSKDALYLLRLLQVPDRVVRHSRTVAAVALALGQALQPHMPGLDLDLLRSAGLLHDMAKESRRHGAVGQTLLENLGLHRLGSVVGAHMVLPPEQLAAALPTEEQLVYLADKMVVEDRVASVDERAAHTLQKHAGDLAVARGVESRIRAAKRITERVEAISGRPLAQIVAPAVRKAALDD